MTDHEAARRYAQAPCGLLSTTVGGVILEANETMQDWTGLSADELAGRTFTSLLHGSSVLFFETRHSQILHLQGRVDEVALSIARADGSVLPVLVSSAIVDLGEGPVVLTAVFSAAGRIAYEQDLLHARRAAEASESRVRILQSASTAFSAGETPDEVAAAISAFARGAFAASSAAVLLFDAHGDLQLAAGTNPLAGMFAPIPSLQATEREIVVTADSAEAEHPQLTAGLRAARLEALSISPLANESASLGLLVCFFGREREFDAAFFDLQRAIARQASETLLRARLQRELEYLAHYDQLTGVANRQCAEQKLAEAIDRAAETATPLSVLFLDVDDFKQINDRFGHAAGDAALAAMASRIREGVRHGDTVGRVGGDEFIAICGDTGQDAAAAIAERVREIVGTTHGDDPSVADLSVSVGVAVYDPGAQRRPTVDEILKRADDAMYRAKGGGKNRVSAAGPR